MASSENNIREVANKVEQSRARIMSNLPYFAPLIFGTTFEFDYREKTISTDGNVIYINPNYIKDCTTKDLDFLILHEIFHIALLHPFRVSAEVKKDKLYHDACDLVVNSYLLDTIYEGKPHPTFYLMGEKIITQAPNKKEAKDFSVEEVYKMLKITGPVKKEEDKDDTPKGVELFEIYANQKGLIYLGNYNKESNLTESIENKLLIEDQFDSLCKIGLAPFNLKIDYIAPFDLNPIVSQEISKEHNKNSFNVIKLKYNKNIYEKISFYNLTNKKTHYDALSKKIYANQKYFEVPTRIQPLLIKFLNERNFTINSDTLIEDLLDYVRSYSHYVFDPKLDQNDNGLVEFLENEVGGGNCYFYNTLLTYIFRMFKIPARLATGFLASTKGHEKKMITSNEAHAWCEIFLNNAGWIIVDATPSSAGSGGDDEGESDGDGEGEGNGNESASGSMKIDSHSRWNEKDEELEERLQQIKDGVEQSLKLAGNIPGFMKEIINAYEHKEVDWRTVLNEFIQFEVNDYSFMQPDRRFSETDFILPSFSDETEKIENILFLVDSSGSMITKDIEMCFGEILSAIKTYQGRIVGYISFFDTRMSPPMLIEDSTKLTRVEVPGRGGTSLHGLIPQIDRYLPERPLAIIILTDGYLDYPSARDFCDIPVCWIFTTSGHKPSYGRILFMKGETKNGN